MTLPRSPLLHCDCVTPKSKREEDEPRVWGELGGGGRLSVDLTDMRGLLIVRRLVGRYWVKFGRLSGRAGLRETGMQDPADLLFHSLRPDLASINWLATHCVPFVQTTSSHPPQ